MTLPIELKYTKDHEWTKTDAGDVVVGITAFAVEQLGDVTLVNVDVKVGDNVTAGKAFGSIESVKTLSDLIAPVSGKVSRINADLEKSPELVNEDCYGKAWMIAIKADDASQLSGLMDSNAYGEYLKAAAH